MIVFLCFLVSAQDLNDGEIVIAQSKNPLGSQDLYKFRVNSVDNQDLVFSLTSYSDKSDPDLYIRKNFPPTLDEFDAVSKSGGSDSIIFSQSILQAGTDFHIMVACSTLCHYSLVVSYTKVISLQAGVPVSSSLSKGREALYRFDTGDSQSDMLVVQLLIHKGNCNFYVSIGEDSHPTSESTEKTEKTWDGNFEFRLFDFEKNTTVKIAIQSTDDLEFSLTAKSSKIDPTLIQAGSSIPGEVLPNHINFYYLSVLNQSDSLEFSLTVMSGEADLLVKFNHFPTIENHDFSSFHFGSENLVITKEDLAKLGFVEATCFVGVVGAVHSVYKLTVVTSTSSVVRLMKGQPVSASVQKGGFKYFSIPAPGEVSFVSVSLTAEIGDPDLYVVLCKMEVSKCLIREKDFLRTDVFASRSYTGNEFIYFLHDYNECLDVKSDLCNYMIAVYGTSNTSTFTLNAVTNSSDEFMMIEGKPLKLTINEEEAFKRLKFFVFNLNVTQVDFILTPLSGNPDLFGSLNLADDKSDYQKDSLNLGVEVDSISWVKGLDSESLRGTYDLKVTCFNPCSFTILGKTSIPAEFSPIKLIPGHPQKDSLFKTSLDSRMYSFHLNFPNYESREKLIITLTAITGTFSFFVGNNKDAINMRENTFKYIWHKNNIGEASPAISMIIQPNDPFYMNGNTYLVLVTAQSYLADDSATYMISFSTGDRANHLVQGLAFNSEVAESQFIYFVYPVQISDEELQIAVTAFSGDCDLYVSVSPNETKSTVLKYDFKSATLGNEHLTLNWENDLKQRCSGIGKDSIYEKQTLCYLFIAVFGSHSSTFNIKVTSDKHLASFLNIGQPLQLKSAQSEKNSFYSILKINKGFIVSLQVDHGDPDIFLNIQDKHDARGESVNWDFPSEDSFLFSSQSANKNELIEVDFTELFERCSGGTCLVLVTVSCKSQTCVSFLQISEKEGIQVIIENQPTFAVSSKDFKYFQYFNNEADNDLLISFTFFDCLNADIFVNKGEKLPDYWSYDWNSNSLQGKVFISKDDLKVAGSMKGSFIIAIIDNNGTCSFSLQVNNHPSKIMKLVSGSPQYSNLTEDSVDFYSFSSLVKEDIVVSVTPSSGSCVLYISTFSEMDVNDYSKIPGPDRFFWSSFTSQDPSNILIPLNDSRFCVNCLFLIGVYPKKSTCVYRITAKNVFDLVLLQNGIPLKVRIKEKHVHVFSFTVYFQQDFVVSLTSYSFIGSFYVTNSKNREKVQESWEISGFQGNKIIRVRSGDEKFKVGTFYIVVENYEFALFTIFASTTGKAVSLIDGWPSYYELVSELENQVQFTFLSSSLQAHCLVKSYSSVRPHGNYEMISNQSSPLFPLRIESDRYWTPLFYTDLQTGLPPSSYYSFDINMPADKNLLNIGLSLGNFSDNESKSSPSCFSLLCSSSSQPALVSHSDTNIGFLSKSSPAIRYELFAPTKGRLTIKLLPCTGEFILKLSSFWNRASNESPDFFSSSMTDGMILGFANNAEGSYFLTITSKKPILSQHISLEYRLSVYFTPTGQAIPKIYVAGGSGLISWNRREGSGVSLEWRPVEDEEGKTEGFKVEYEVFFFGTKKFNQLISQDPPLDMESACPYQFGYVDDSFKCGKSNSTTALCKKIPKKKGYVVVVAKLLNYPWDSIVYDVTEVSIETLEVLEHENLLIFWVLAGFLVIAVLVALFFWRRSKLKDTILNYEMSDISNIGTIKKLGIDQNERYSHFE